jgi:hypothetical protein
MLQKRATVRLESPLDGPAENFVSREKRQARDSATYPVVPQLQSVRNTDAFVVNPQVLGAPLKKNR